MLKWSAPTTHEKLYCCPNNGRAWAQHPVTPRPHGAVSCPSRLDHCFDCCIMLSCAVPATTQ